MFMKQIIKAFAKFNLLLNVLSLSNCEAKHQLQSIMCIDYMHYDEIIIEAADAYSIAYYKDNKPITINSDSITTGLKWLKTHFSNFTFNYHVTVFKHIPLGSGLGGESSDCAAVLDYALQLNKFILNSELKLDIALNVGSDICFFLSKYNQAYVSKYGNEVIALPKIEINYLLAITPTATSTKAVFDTFDRLSLFSTFSYSYEKCLQIIEHQAWNLLQNNLLLSAFAVNDELRLIYQTLVHNYHNYYVYLNGSGSSFLLISKSKLQPST